jgi:mannonate dehydratase
MLAANTVPVLEEIREHHPILFDFVLKRHLTSRGKHFAAGVFETRRFFDRSVA